LLNNGRYFLYLFLYHLGCMAHGAFYGTLVNDGPGAVQFTGWEKPLHAPLAVPPHHGAQWCGSQSVVLVFCTQMPLQFQPQKGRDCSAGAGRTAAAPGAGPRGVLGIVRGARALLHIMAASLPASFGATVRRSM